MPIEGGACFPDEYYQKATAERQRLQQEAEVRNQRFREQRIRDEFYTELAAAEKARNKKCCIIS